MRNRKNTRGLSLLLCAALLAGQLGTTVYAEGSSPVYRGGVCEHHPEHTEACGYMEAEPGQPCQHQHTKDCYTDELICGFDDEDTPTATDSDASAVHEHTQECYTLDCPHERGEHDDTCGYVEAVPESPCTHSCELCDPQDKENVGGADREDGLDHSDPTLETSEQNEQTTLANDGLMPPVATVSNVTSIEGNGYSFESGTLTITTNEGTAAWRYGSNSIDKNDITKVVVEDGVTELRNYFGNGAFENCENLAQAELPSSLKSIEVNAFRNCGKLELTELPDKVTSIEHHAFQYCGKIELTSLPRDLKSIGNWAFSNCENLALEGLPSNLTSIEIGGFKNCKNLALKSLPGELTSIEDYAFQYCENLALEELPEKVTSIGNAAFSRCGNLALERLPSDLKSIGDSAFSDCKNLALTSLPSELTSIGNLAFENCIGLTSLTLPMPKAPTLGKSAFDGIPNLTIFVPAGATEYDTGGWTQYADKLVFGAALESLTISNGDLAPAFFAGTENYNVSVPNSTTSVTVTPTAHGTGTITVNDIGIDSGVTSEEITLEAGKANEIKIVVENSSTDSRTYTVTVTRAADPVCSIEVTKESLDFGTVNVGYEVGKDADDPDPRRRSVVVTNTGSQDVTLTPLTLPPSTAYELAELSKLELRPGEIADFIIWPKTDLSPGTYNEQLTISGTGGARATVDLKFTVTDKPTYSIKAIPTELVFDSVTVGDAPPAEQTVTVENTGNQSVTLTTLTAIAYTVGEPAPQTIEPRKTASFTVQPKADLVVDTYNETLTINGTGGARATVDLKFTVTDKPTYSIKAIPTELVFDSVTVGDTPPAEQTVTVENMGNQNVTLTTPTAIAYTVGEPAPQTIEPGKTASFTVQPKADLAVDTYNETLTINGTGNARTTVDLKFTVTDKPTYTVMVTAEGGGTASANPTNATAGTEIVLTADSFDGWRFDHWTVISGTANIQDDRFIMPAENVSVKAVFVQVSNNHNGSSGSRDSSVTITTPQPPQPDSPVLAVIKTPVIVTDGAATGTANDGDTSEGIIKALNTAKQKSREKYGIAIQYDAATAAAYDGFSITISRATLDRLLDPNNNLKYLTLNTSIVDMTFGLAELTEIARQTSGDVTFTAARVTGLTGDSLSAISTRPAYDLKISYQKDGQTVYLSSVGSVSVGLAYTPAETEQAGGLYLVYADGKGGAEWLYRSSYDKGSGNVIGSINHFSIYGVGYRPAPIFTDTVNHWAKSDIDFVASRNLLTGTGAAAFSPDSTITRGMFVTALGRLSGIDPAAYPSSSRFSDVPATAYYAPFVEWAASKEIVNGTGAASFEPDRPVTREEMAVIMQRYAGKLGYTLPKEREAEIFTDNATITSDMKDAVQAMQQAGVMNGKGGRLFAPKDTATRAEAAAVLRRFVEIVIDRDTAGGWAQNDTGSWLYYENHRPVTGWKQVESTWYYFDAAGLMQSGGWRQIGGKWYYFYADGSMAANTEIDGYQIGPDGARNF